MGKIEKNKKINYTMIQDQTDGFYFNNILMIRIGNDITHKVTCKKLLYVNQGCT